MDLVFSSFEILFDYRIYLTIFIGLMIVMPITFISKGLILNSFANANEENGGYFIFNLFSNNITLAIVKTFSELYIYLTLIPIFIYGYPGLDLGFVLTVLSEKAGIIIALMFIVFLVSLFVEGTDLEFLIGIFLIGNLATGNFFPPIPDFWTSISLIIVAVICSFGLVALVNMLVIRVFGDWDAFQRAGRMSSDPRDTYHLYNQNIVEVFFSIFLGKVVMMVPVAMYGFWIAASL